MGFVVGVLVGAVIGAVVGYRPRGHAAAVGSGVLLGMLAWMAESLTLLPVLTGEPVTWALADAEATFPFLVGRLLYGALTGLGTHYLLAVLTRTKLASTGASVPPPTRRVVVLGGGFAGISTAQRLEHRLARRTDVEVTLVSDSNYLLFTPMLAEVAAGALQARHISAPVRALCPHTVFHQARVEAVDTDRQEVRLRRGDDHPPEVLHYDHLVVALGATANYRGLPGVAEHAFALKTLGDAIRLRNHVIGLLERADVEPDPVRRCRQLTFVVAGGGFAGAELIAELFDLVHDVRRYYPRIDPAELRFVLVHSRERILPELSRELADYALADLRLRGVEFALSARVAEMTEEEVLLSDGQRMPTCTLVWTAGNQPHPLVAELPGRHAGNDALAVTPTLQVRGVDNVWALGDCAAVPDVTSPGEFHPPTAQHALREGRTAADNIVAELDRKPAKPFRFRTIGLLVALGHQKGAAELRGRPFSGLLAWLLWRGTYLSKLPGAEKKIRVALDWTLDLFFSRDVVLTEARAVQPRPRVTSPEPDRTR
ncbi:NAD(P)/FAD-dependent oxidoreductase [Allosalinactinospora lopnorensis]|uniref:NAD(P)/FAD-dependent oxidoreductase n=1 Tax=Allosalinactinospora lopnorensis TaxID=1352348 RepID=UPI000AF47F02|nr:NAD(P)/FAD-dependent oxidoreductase [Allosalinactinospora lopnorensis]